MGTYAGRTEVAQDVARQQERCIHNACKPHRKRDNYVWLTFLYMDNYCSEQLSTPKHNLSRMQNNFAVRQRDMATSTASLGIDCNTKQRSQAFVREAVCRIRAKLVRDMDYQRGSIQSGVATTVHQ
mmetsp:Transcript_15893/g.36178  ORF Transcript_15893/g.36178 Transcript_15893/m.36178 type:complete len:126 (+) Transcript_15893:1-378(+)